MKRLLLTLLWLVWTTSAMADNDFELVQSWGTLRGTEVEAQDKGHDMVVIFIAGSGPTDRNGNQPSMQTFTYRQIADSLSRCGIASLLYDKRGIAASRYNDPSELLSDCHFYHYVDDAQMLVNYAKELGYQRVALAGHSEGSLIALLVAQREPNVDKVISLAGAGQTIDCLLKMQLMPKLMGVDYSLYTRACRILDSLRRGEKPTDVPSQLQALFPEYLNDFWTEEISHDPCKIISTLDCDILIIGGERDIQVAPINAKMLHEANPKSRMEIITDMAHTLKHTTGGDVSEQIDAYTNPSLAVKEQVVDLMVEFLL